MEEHEPELPNVGRLIRALRQQRGISLRDLADGCGLSRTAISLIERGVSSPTVASLHRLATALGVPISFFFQPQEEQREVIVTRAHGRRHMGTAGLRLESLGSGLKDQTIEPFVVTLEPGRDSGATPIVHPGHELVYCLEGVVEYRVAGESYRLTAGDALLFEARLHHGWRNPGDRPAVFLLVVQAAGTNSVEPHLRT